MDVLVDTGAVPSVDRGPDRGYVQLAPGGVSEGVL
jgi:hypothetical protein